VIIEVLDTDITKLEVDAIANAAPASERPCERFLGAEADKYGA
jgi:hypothetical protein